ncbi:hypothetical protein Spa11_27700 [Botrimarina mediterranea]|uniref:Prenyltransferase and squalene oxidase repeat protein n=2 Tax=Botrimarina mediterranea TaxID=2528022 RepID=A0A518K9U4_9BACT|nr:hypothetical protein Spa11_27700 [Botrimarina mediterranea]
MGYVERQPSAGLRPVMSTEQGKYRSVRASPTKLRGVSRYVTTVTVVWGLCIAQATALLPTSPRVSALVEAGVKTLETIPFDGGQYDRMLGSKCLVGLALHKAGKKNSPRIKEAIQACAERAGEVSRDNFTYSQCLAVIFLSEVAPKTEKATIQQYLNMFTKRQLPHGGWGYVGEQVGDTSQTQYVALAMWQAHRAGVSLDDDQVKGLMSWLNKTQAPDGGWGYHGVVPDGGKREAQAGVTPTLTAAAMASLMIGADLHGLLNAGSMSVAAGTGNGGELPPSLRFSKDRVSSAKPLSPSGVDWKEVTKSFELGEQWMNEAPFNSAGAFPFYYLYALERYHSFNELRSGESELEPEWYEQGVDYLEGSQIKPGQWNNGCGAPADTAFAVLFLMRATQKSLQGGIGEGALVSGRGLPKNLSSATLKRGQVVVEMDVVGVADFLSMMEKGEADRLDALAADPSALLVGKLSSADAARLSQVLRAGEPNQRLVAARALGSLGDLDFAPVLMYGLTDPDPRVALASRDGLRAIARRPRGFGMPDEFNDDQRYAELEQWKRWYLTLRPEAVIDLGR